MQQTCVLCSQACTKHCTRCKGAYYCSGACQKSDWPIHKLFCAAYSNFDLSERPTEQHILACLFPVGSNTPQMIWLPCEWHQDEYSRHQLPRFGSELGLDHCQKTVPIQYNNVLKRHLPNTLCISFRDTFLIDGSQANRSIFSIMSIRPGQQHHDWRGPIIAYSRQGQSLDPPACRDLHVTDLRHIADYFLSYGVDDLSTTGGPDEPKIKAVKINCLGDQKILRKPKFEPVDVSSTDSIFFTNHNSGIAERVELPVYTHRCTPSSAWVNDRGSSILEGHSPFENQDATFLHLCCDPNAEFGLETLGWGWAPMQWQNNVGSVLVVRQDKKPLSALHVEALCAYCRHWARPLLAHSIGEYAPEKPMSKDSVLAMICRATFVIHWYEFLGKKRQAGEDDDAPFPFDV